MTTVFNDPVPTCLIDDSPYQDSLEKVAPNICTLIKSSAVVRENWWNTLSRVLPSINSTPEQDGALMGLAVRAASGLLPEGYTPPTETTHTPLTAEKFLTYAGIAGVIWRLIF